MEKITKIMTTIWEIVNKNNKFYANICTIDGEIRVSIISGKKKMKRFIGNDENIIIDNIKQSFLLN